MILSIHYLSVYFDNGGVLLGCSKYTDAAFEGRRHMHSIVSVDRLLLYLTFETLLRLQSDYFSAK